MSKDIKIQKWVRCPSVSCRRKLFGLRHAKDVNIQIKCPSCRALTTITIIDGKVTTTSDDVGTRFPPKLDYK